MFPCNTTLSRLLVLSGIAWCILSWRHGAEFKAIQKQQKGIAKPYPGHGIIMHFSNTLLRSHG
eukprot:c41401_g1_i1 orf=157-345(+)